MNYVQKCPIFRDFLYFCKIYSFLALLSLGAWCGSDERTINELGQIGRTLDLRSCPLDEEFSWEEIRHLLTSEYFTSIVFPKGIMVLNDFRTVLSGLMHRPQLRLLDLDGCYLGDITPLIDSFASFPLLEVLKVHGTHEGDAFSMGARGFERAAQTKNLARSIGTLQHLHTLHFDMAYCSSKTCFGFKHGLRHNDELVATAFFVGSVIGLSYFLYGLIYEFYNMAVDECFTIYDHNNFFACTYGYFDSGVPCVVNKCPHLMFFSPSTARLEIPTARDFLTSVLFEIPIYAFVGAALSLIIHSKYNLSYLLSSVSSLIPKNGVIALLAETSSGVLDDFIMKKISPEALGIVNNLVRANRLVDVKLRNVFGYNKDVLKKKIREELPESRLEFVN
jgi:hypothetical protein